MLNNPKKRKKNPAAVALAKLGASKGGLARAAKLSPRKRSRIAKRAVEARWAKHRESR
jgi:ABC-type phosphate/phosphonate transport system ATPase subunit